LKSYRNCLFENNRKEKYFLTKYCKQIKKIDFLGLRVGDLTRMEITEKIMEFLCVGDKKFITYINAHCINVSFNDKEYRDILNSADLLYTGGEGIIWASKLFRRSLDTRVNILDFFDILAKELSKTKTKIYLLGTEASILKRAVQNLSKAPFNLNIVGFQHGFFKSFEETEIIDRINLLKPDILMVGMGVPKQEKWIYQHLDELDVKLCWAVGGVFEWLSGYRKRAPRLMIECGLEWLHRLFQQPQRLGKRYVVGNPLFVYRVLKWRMTNGSAN